MREIQQEELELLATGAWILGAGGGGNPYLSWLNLRKLYEDGTRISLLDPAELADDDPVATCASIGAPLVGRERMADPAFAARPVLAIQDYLKCRLRAVMSVEIGGSNALYPLLVAAVTGLPVVDADTMGRAFPEGQMASFAIAGLPMPPLVLSDIRETDIIVPRVESARWSERITRRICFEMGSVAATCRAPRTGLQIRNQAILHTTTRAISIGRTVHEARRRHEDPVAALVAAEDSAILMRGKVQDIARRSTDAFLRGRVRIDGLDSDRGSVLELEFQNEFSAAWRDGEVVVTTPDIICMLDSVTGESIGTETIRYGQRVSVIALPPPDFFLTPAGLAATGPRAFGLDLDYRGFRTGRSARPGASS